MDANDFQRHKPNGFCYSQYKQDSGIVALLSDFVIILSEVQTLHSQISEQMVMDREWPGVCH